MAVRRIGVLGGAVFGKLNMELAALHRSLGRGGPGRGLLAGFVVSFAMRRRGRVISDTLGTVSRLHGDIGRLLRSLNGLPKRGRRLHSQVRRFISRSIRHSTGLRRLGSGITNGIGPPRANSGSRWFSIASGFLYVIVYRYVKE